MARLQEWAKRFHNPNPEQMIASVERFVRSKFYYLGEDVETLRTVEKMLDTLEQTGKIIGDCDDICIFLASIFQSLLPVKFTAIRTTPAEDFLHVFVQVFNGRSWKVIDPTIAPHVMMRYYGSPMEVTV